MSESKTHDSAIDDVNKNQEYTDLVNGRHITLDEFVTLKDIKAIEEIAHQHFMSIEDYLRLVMNKFSKSRQTYQKQVRLTAFEDERIQKRISEYEKRNRRSEGTVSVPEYIRHMLTTLLYKKLGKDLSVGDIVQEVARQKTEFSQDNRSVRYNIRFSDLPMYKDLLKFIYETGIPFGSLARYAALGVIE